MLPRQMLPRQMLRRQPIRVSLHPPRCYVFGRRIHHGLVGVLLLFHDCHDWRVWLRDLVKHPGAR